MWSQLRDIAETPEQIYTGIHNQRSVTAGNACHIQISEERKFNLFPILYFFELQCFSKMDILSENLLHLVLFDLERMVCPGVSGI